MKQFEYGKHEVVQGLWLVFDPDFFPACRDVDSQSAGCGMTTVLVIGGQVKHPGFLSKYSEAAILIAVQDAGLDPSEVTLVHLVDGRCEDL
jgi:hypothetical protein